MPCHSDEFPSVAKRSHFSVLDKSKVKQIFGIDIAYWKESLEKYFCPASKRINYKAIDSNKILAYIRTCSSDDIAVDDITNKSGTESLRIGTILFELEQKKIITVTEKFAFGAPKMIRLNIEK